MNIDFTFRCARVWWFLSLDVVAKHADPLGLPWFGREHLAYVRSRLDLKQDLPISHFDPRVKTYERLQGFRQTFGNEHLEHLLWWQRCVYTQGGHDRVGELLWWHFVNGGFKTTDHHLASVFGTVREEVLGQRQALAAPAPVSEWDEQAVAAEESSIEQVEQNIDEILTCNIFAKAWQRTATPLGMDVLIKAFELVCADDKARGGIDEGMLPFPSSWEIELKL